jgi:hypothetical protein
MLGIIAEGRIGSECLQPILKFVYFNFYMVFLCLAIPPVCFKKSYEETMILRSKSFVAMTNVGYNVSQPFVVADCGGQSLQPNRKKYENEILK